MTFNKGGTLTISGGSLAPAGVSAFSGLTLSGGTLTASSALTVSGTMTVSSGTISGNNAITLNGPFNWSGGTVAMTTGTGSINITNGPTTINGTNATLTSGNVTNGAVATMSANSLLNIGAGGTLTNLASGTWNVSSGRIQSTGAGLNPSFFNSGTFSQTLPVAAPIGFFFVGVAFSGNGQANVSGSGNQLRLAGGGTYSGTINVATGASLFLGSVGAGSANFSAAAGSTITGSGNVFFNLNTSSIAGAYNITGVTEIGGSATDTTAAANFNSAGASTSTLSIIAGTLGGTGNLTVTSTMTWGGGTLSNTGTTTIGATGTLNLTDAIAPTKQTAGTLSIAGTANVTGPLDVSGATINVLSGGSFNLAADVSIGALSAPLNATSFNNAGTLTKAGTSGNGGFTGSVALNNTGTINANSGILHLDGGVVQAGANSTINLNGGNINLAPSAMAINGGTLVGTGTITGNVTNAAIVKPGHSPGAITISGNYTQTAAGALNIELDSTSLFSVLNISGAATLGGTLNVSVVGFTPVVGNAFKIMTFTGGSGGSNFATENGLSQVAGIFLQPTINPADLTLNAITSTVTLTPNSINFDNVLLNTTSATMSAMLTNNTGASITISSITPGGANVANAPEFPLQTGAGICAVNTMLTVGSSCNLTYAFKPTALGAQGPITVTITDSRTAPGNTNVLTLNGTGIAPDVTVTMTHNAATDFVVNTASNMYTITVTNNGNGPTAGAITASVSFRTGLTYFSSNSKGWTCTVDPQKPQSVTCDYTGVPLAAAGGNSTFVINVLVAPNAITVTNPPATGFTAMSDVIVNDPNDSNPTEAAKTAIDTVNLDNAVPTQTMFSPSGGLIAGTTTDQQIMLTGTGFNASTQVTGFGTTLTGTASADGKTLTITVPHAELATAPANGIVTISVTNPKNPTTQNGGGTAPANQSFPLVGVNATQDASNPGTIAVKAGTPAMVKIDYATVPATSQLPAALTIACSVPQSLTGATCSVSNSTIAAGALSGSTTVTINAIPTSAAATPTNKPGGPWPSSTYLQWFIAAALLSMLGMLGAVRQRTLSLGRAPVYLALVLLVLAAGALVGCTTSSKSMGPTPTPTGPSMITVTATAADGATIPIVVNINVSN